MQLLAGRYRLAEPVGRGGMAVVHRAFDEVLKRQVAVKILSPETHQDKNFRDTVRRDALAAAQLCHPNVAAVHDYGETGRADGRRPFLVMEFVPGGTLSSRLATDGSLTWSEAAELCAGVAAALAAAHASGLVHRDIKPANIMLSPTGVKVVDFGIAATVGQAAVDTDGRLWGTPAYLAPEQIREETVGPATDVYALGLVFHACLTGRPPWPGATGDEVLAARRHTPVPALPDAAGLPHEIAQIYRACVADSPEERPTASEVAQVLSRAVPNESRRSAVRPGSPHFAPATTIAIQPAGASARSRSRSVAALGVPIAAIGALLAVQTFDGTRPEVATAGEPATGPSTAGCSVRYVTRLNPSGTFVARLAVVNTGDDAIANGTVTFGLPAGQRLTRVSVPHWKQTDEVVRLTAPAALKPGTPSTFVLLGTFDPRRPTAPASFALAGVACERAATTVTLADAGARDSAADKKERDDVRQVNREPQPDPPARATLSSPSTTATPSASAPANFPGNTMSATPSPSSTPTESGAATPTSSPPTTHTAAPTGTTSTPGSDEPTGSATPTDPATPASRAAASAASTHPG